MSAPDWVKNEEDEALWGEGLAYDGAPISNKVALLAFLKAKKSQLEHKGIPTSLYSLIVGLSVYLPGILLLLPSFSSIYYPLYCYPAFYYFSTTVLPPPPATQLLLLV
jgi:hypothetical protein